VQRIIRAYDDYKGRNEQLSLSLDARSGNAQAAPRSTEMQAEPRPDSEASLAEAPPERPLQQQDHIIE
jgi:hypothetical protein